MKALISTLTILLSLLANASQESQMLQVLGDWNSLSVNSNLVLRVEKQSENSIRVFECRRDRYLAGNRYCLYRAIRIAYYQSQVDGFVVPAAAGQCLYVFQVSADQSNSMLKMYDPYNTSGTCLVAGQAEPYEKM